MSMTWYIVVFGIIAATIGYVTYNFFLIRKMSEGTCRAALYLNQRPQFI